MIWSLKVFVCELSMLYAYIMPFISKLYSKQNWSTEQCVPRNIKKTGNAIEVQSFDS